MTRLGLPDDTPIEHKWITKSIEKAQKKVENYHFSIRKQILEYDDVMNKQRETIYSLRSYVLKEEKMGSKIKEIISDIITCYYEQTVNPKDKESLPVFNQRLTHLISDPSIEKELTGISVDKLKEAAVDILVARYDQKIAENPAPIFEKYVVKRTLLYTLDRKWKDHLLSMDVLREGIGLRAYGQKDPLMEYKIEAF